MSRQSQITRAGIVAALICGCDRYTSVPLRQQDIDAALTSPAPEALRVSASNLRHPILPPIVVDTRDGLTPDEAAVVAVLVNPMLRGERDRIKLAGAQLLQAGVLPNPTLAYNLDIPVGSNTGGEVSGYGLGLDWEITSLISRSAKLSSAGFAVAQVRLDVAWQEWQVAEAARQAAYDVITLRSLLRDAQRSNDQLGPIADGLDQALQRHDITAADAVAGRAAAQDAGVTVAAARRELRDAEFAFTAALGVTSDAAIAVQQDSVLPQCVAVPSTAELLEHLCTRRLDLVALRRGYDSQEETVRAAVLGQFPRINLGISNTRDFGNFFTLGPTISADLPFFDRNQGNIAIARATRKQLYDEYVSRIQQARSDVVRAAAAITAINDQIAAESADIGTLRRLVDLDERTRKQGNLEISTYYAAAVNLTQKQADLAKLRQDLMHARIALELAAGIYLPNLPATEPTTRESETQ